MHILLAGCFFPIKLMKITLFAYCLPDIFIFIFFDFVVLTDIPSRKLRLLRKSTADSELGLEIDPEILKEELSFSPPNGAVPAQPSEFCLASYLGNLSLPVVFRTFLTETNSVA